jgi:hypothetical protein
MAETIRTRVATDEYRRGWDEAFERKRAQVDALRGQELCIACGAKLEEGDMSKTCPVCSWNGHG